MRIPEPECPSGYPVSQLKEILGDRYPDFGQYMIGQTMMLCEGTYYIYKREHNDYCMNPDDSFMRWHPDYIAHTENSKFDWTCGYIDGGHYEDTSCSASPHGPVVYRVDLIRFLEGLPPFD